jgi:hypothetical protein
MAQPITRRVKTSNTATRYNHPWPVRTQVASVARLDPGVARPGFARGLGAIGPPCRLSVVTTPIFGALPGEDSLQAHQGVQCGYAAQGNRAHEPVEDCHRSDDCAQTPPGCARASGRSPHGAVRVGGAASSSRNSRCAKPEAPHRATLLCVGRSSVRSGHTSRRHFGEDAQ